MVVGLATLIALSEIALRLLDLPRPEVGLEVLDAAANDRVRLPPDPRTFWRLGADQDWGAPLNRFGLCGAEPDAQKSDRGFRIAVLGGSTALGAGVDHDASFAALTERAVQDELPNARIELLLAAVPGYSTFQSLRLWQAVGPAFAPDLVILYCGLADCAPAVQAADAEVAHAREHASRWRLLRLLRQLTGKAAPTAEQRQQMSATDAAPHGRRVSVADFEANVGALIDAAVAQGAEVCVVVPAASDAFETRVSVLGDYRAALRRAVQNRSAFLLDGDGLVRAFESAMDRPPCADVGLGHGLRDDTHLSPEGHAVLAQMLITRARAHARFSTLAALPPAPTPQAVQLDPATVVAGSDAEVRLTGRGLAAAKGLRAWFDAYSAPIRVVDDEHAVVQVPRQLPPGRRPLRLTSDHGLATGDGAIGLEVTPCPLEVTLQRAGDSVRVELSGRAPAGSKVHVYVAPAGRTTPTPTRAGPFWLQVGAVGEKPARAPFCFGSLPFTHFAAESGADSTWHIVSSWQPDAIFASAVFQGVAWLPHDRVQGLVTEVAVRGVPR